MCVDVHANATLPSDWLAAVSVRAIEEVYRESCEQKGKEQPQYSEAGPSDDLMLTDTTVWQKVQQLRQHGNNMNIILMNVLVLARTDPRGGIRVNLYVLIYIFNIVFRKGFRGPKRNPPSSMISLKHPSG